MKNTLLAISLAIFPVGQPFLVGSTTALTTSALFITLPTKVQAQTVDSYNALAKESYWLGDYESALSYLNKSHLIDDTNQEAYFITGQVLLKKAG